MLFFAQDFLKITLLITYVISDDHSRVVLTPLPGQKKTTDYINGNFIDGFRRFHAYIGTQVGNVVYFTSDFEAYIHRIIQIFV